MPPTTLFSPGDVVLVRVTFTDQLGGKVRPAIVVSQTSYQAARRELVIIPITSQGTSYHFDVVLFDWATAGLIKASVAKGVLQTVEAAAVQRAIGKLSAADSAKVLANLPKILALL